LHEGRTPATVPQRGAMIREAAQFLNSTGLPILLRIGGEVDVWTTPANPAEFIAAFRFIANIMRQYAPNVAMVYSVNSVSSQGIGWRTFFPGYDYVDWIGISLYSTRYFLGNPATTDITAAIYRTGQFANPISFIQELTDEFPTMPIIISEGGVSLYNISNSEDLTDWALPVMRQIYYYIPMLFPQVKVIIWFNVYVPGGNQRYDFPMSPRALALYHELTAAEHFIRRGQTESPVTFAQLGTDSITMPRNAVTLAVFAPFFSLPDIWVEYRLDGAWLGLSRTIPYRQTFDFTNRPNGTKHLQINIFSNDTLLQRLNFDLLLHENTATITPR